MTLSMRIGSSVAAAALIAVGGLTALPAEAHRFARVPPGIRIAPLPIAA